MCREHGKFLTGLKRWISRLLVFAICGFLLTAMDHQPVVTLTSFTGEVEDDHVLLEWETSTELNSAGFYINRGEQEGNYTRIGDFIASTGDGATGEEYSYEDWDVEWGTVYYYVLEMVDIDGEIELSDSISVNFGDDDGTPTVTPTTDPADPYPGPTLTQSGSNNTNQDPYPGPGSPVAPTATRTSRTTSTPTQPAAGATRTPTRRSTGPTTATPFGSPAVTGVISDTATLIPLPSVTLLFPVNPTSTSTITPTETTPQALAMSIGEQEDTGGTEIKVLGGLILLIWVLLGAFLFTYLRRLGY